MITIGGRELFERPLSFSTGIINIAGDEDVVVDPGSTGTTAIGFVITVPAGVIFPVAIGENITIGANANYPTVLGTFHNIGPNTIATVAIGRGISTGDSSREIVTVGHNLTISDTVVDVCSVGRQHLVDSQVASSVLMGLNLTANGVGSNNLILIGNSVTISNHATVAANIQAIGAGLTVGINSNNTVVLGSGSLVGVTSNNSTAIGSNVSIHDNADHTIAVGNTLAIGAASGASSTYHVVLANNCTIAAGTGSVIVLGGSDVGITINTTVGDSFTAGHHLTVNSNNQFIVAISWFAAIGSQSYGSIAIGAGAGIGSQCNDAIRIGRNGSFGNNSSDAIGFGSIVTIGDSSASSVSIGPNTAIYGSGNVALGTQATVGTLATPVATSIAIGSGSAVTAATAIAFGIQAAASAVSVMAFGIKATAASPNQVIFGSAAGGGAQTVENFSAASSIGPSNLLFQFQSTAAAARFRYGHAPTLQGSHRHPAVPKSDRGQRYRGVEGSGLISSASIVTRDDSVS